MRIAALVLAVVTAACGSTVRQTPSSEDLGARATNVERLAGDTGSVETAPGIAADGTARARAASRRVTAVTTGRSAAGAGPRIATPIKVGFYTVDYAAAAAAIVGPNADAEPGDAQYGAKVWVDAINKTGGLTGRQIHPYYRTFDATAADWNTQDEAACNYFTQDVKVDVVIAQDGTSLAPCLLKNGVVEINNSAIGPDTQRMRELPNAFFPDAPSMNRQAAAVIDQMTSTGWLTPKDHVGVLIADCASYRRVYENVIAPRAKNYGFQVEMYAAYSCPTGFSDVPEIAQGSQTAAFRFKANGVTRVMYMTPVANLINYLFSSNAEQQGWHPGYLLDTSALLYVNKDDIPPRQIVNMKGAGWFPGGDLAQPMPVTPPRQQCLDAAKAGGQGPPDVTKEIEYNSFFSVCGMMNVLSAGLVASNGSAEMADLVRALELAGLSVQSPMSHGPIMFGALPRRDGVVTTAPYSWHTECNCVRYDRPPTEAKL